VRLASFSAAASFIKSECGLWCANFRILVGAAWTCVLIRVIDVSGLAEPESLRFVRKEKVVFVGPMVSMIPMEPNTGTESV
jgi:hypothetical protein